MNHGTGKPPSSPATAPAQDGQLFPYADTIADHPRPARVAKELDKRFWFRREIGRGGAAYVFLADDRRTGEQVAVKVLRSDVAAVLGEFRFHREIDIARSLEHSNILPMLESGAADGQLYFTMPYVAGATLRERLRTQRQLPLSETIAIARAISDALDHAHARGFVHRDIKPANILLDGSRTVVADFGIARATTAPAGSERTDSGITIGTPEYMSPEQATAVRELDARSDIYALGCVVYEMLAGEPPFTGPSAQAVIARHCHEPPRSLRVIRPAVPLDVQIAVERALAKVPADRYATAGEFVAALEAGAVSTRQAPRAAVRSRRARIAATILAVAALAAGGWYYTRPAGPTPDRNRIVVFPLYDGAAPNAAASSGEEVATFIGYALDGTRPLKWLDGWELLGDASSRIGRLEPKQARQLALAAGAGYYIEGSIVRQRDSSLVLLSLFSVTGDSLVRRVPVAGPTATASVHQLGLTAVAQLLPDLVSPGGKIDLSALSQRRPLAVANFLQGEREYRRMQFNAALTHYESALGEDSAFALAALRGAQAANWLSEFGIAVTLAEAAERQLHALPPAQASVARGLRAYLTGAADSAIVYLQNALESDSTLHTAWALLGEVASRMLPSIVSADSLALQALNRARREDADFAPTLLLLEERALRAGDLTEALALREALRKAGADTTHAKSRDLMFRCVRDGPRSINWSDAVLDDKAAVLATAKILAGRAAQAHCAATAFKALLAAEDTPPNERWAALVGLQALLAATNRPQQAESVFSASRIEGLPVQQLHLLLAMAGAGFVPQATVEADSSANVYAMRTTVRLWLLGSWEASRNNLVRTREIAQRLKEKSDSSSARRDLLLSRAIAARLRLLEADSVGALRLLRALSPTGQRGDIEWQPWESLGPERLLLAEVLFARGDYIGARRVAELLDATEPVTYPLYLRASLQLRIRAAEATNDTRAAAEYSRRLAQLTMDPFR
jgi:hypothetical protein